MKIIIETAAVIAVVVNVMIFLFRDSPSLGSSQMRLSSKGAHWKTDSEKVGDQKVFLWPNKTRNDLEHKWFST